MPNYRKDFPSFAPTVYLDCAYQGPFPRAAIARIHHAVELMSHPERIGSAEFFDLPDRVRAGLAGLIGANANEIAIMNSVTQGIGVVAAGLSLKAGDEVMVASSNFPSNLYTWLHLRRRGVIVQVLKPVEGLVRLEDVHAALTPRTRVLALDWVSYTTGLTIDLAAMGELAHRHECLFVVDASQGAGAVPLNVRGLPVDAVALTGYKWLLGPYGTGFLYLTDRLRERLDLEVISWGSVEGSRNFEALPIDSFTLAKTARIFDVPETASFLNLYALEASLKYLAGVGVGTIHQHCGRLLDRLEEGLRRTGTKVIRNADAKLRSAILGFQADSLEATTALHRKLRANHLAVSLRHGIIRVSPFIYNAETDIDRLLEFVKPEGRKLSRSSGKNIRKKASSVKENETC